MTVTAKQVIAKIREAAESYPEAKAHCLYWNVITNAPECVVGVALHNLGFTEADLGRPHLGTADEALAQLGVSGKKIELAWISVVQAFQDGRLGPPRDWETAVYEADELLGRILGGLNVGVEQ
ncbi:hypothetical protein [Mycobacteroides immunogenum]|uniref:Uncharacterized protein n=1 Tax=Mycobacteroides immunogenum TaxID=83262 RepID=A0A7V8LRK9_9MYCO|nr:hypothetical protein [Mycobacteroides immunogenum]KPG13705.1 hypothetical protein AN909_05415 [Mycobacteroides immunogenum]KPG14306.1 hypothetical protein AN908_06990 [Mycobacteroides immunogenum]KPG14374.1 hypothetical protein AN908_07445 [Mycobacteroides immunogenum]KPG17419.1 hypothetical protein AN910_04640 [Mycobacteroides immunogenum]KPG23997.1 hypothetical protein AN911_00520 [Mycobacteroides immunogenum]